MTGKKLKTFPPVIFSILESVREIMGEERILLNRIKDEEIIIKRSLLSKIYESPGGNQILLRTGRKIGNNFETVEEIKNHYKKTGMGSLEVEELNEEKMVVKLENSQEAFKKGEDSCPFTKGVLIGFYNNYIGESITREHVIGNEKKCIAEGNENCEFEVRPTLDDFTSFFS